MAPAGKTYSLSVMVPADPAPLEVETDGTWWNTTITLDGKVILARSLALHIGGDSTVAVVVYHDDTKDQWVTGVFSPVTVSHP